MSSKKIAKFDLGKSFAESLAEADKYLSQQPGNPEIEVNAVIATANTEEAKKEVKYIRFTTSLVEEIHRKITYLAGKQKTSIQEITNSLLSKSLAHVVLPPDW